MKKSSEHAHQVTLLGWFNEEYPQLEDRLFAIPNGGYRDINTAKKMKAEGVQKGVPDCCLPVARHGYHGLFIEMKKPIGSSTSKEQKDWNAFLTEQGYKAAICKGWEEARDVIIEYLS